ncbi:alpha/beta-hydrolase [Mollisia scopiformis]|uniref:Alpha/beta-hydrolase n=1 Tax=Mollisia scopiformis TaxID=149040 RepID=A0A194XAB9_MOLSC|nr:alpha/beta-hydrolase [Mollisia scopiformis]KUJ17111.1 alpha/beta-hydrolase [Mollisia scopiformis]
MASPHNECIADSLDDSPSDSTTIVSPTADAHTHTIIFLHGREDFSSDLAQYFFDSKSSDDRSMAEIFPSIRWVFPTAKLRFSAQRDFEFSSSSFTEALKGPEERQELMVPGLRESIGEIVEIVKDEATLVPVGNIILGGISQGCATAVLTLLASDVELGGFIGWCSWLPFQQAIERIQKESKDTTPIFLAHSRDDETVPFAMGEGLYQTLERLGFNVTWKKYEDGGHWIHAEHGVDDMSTFLEDVMKD